MHWYGSAYAWCMAFVDVKEGSPVSDSQKGKWIAVEP